MIEILRLRFLKNIITVICIVFLIIIIFLAPFRIFVYDIDTYKELYKKNGVYESISETDAENLTMSIIGYLRNEKEIKRFELKDSRSFFTTDEINHLADVRILIKDIIYILYVSTVFLIIFLVLLSEKNKAGFLKRISVILMSSSSIVIILLILLYFFSNNFIPLFEGFHYIFFPQGNWAFPENSLLITLLPLGFFYEFFIKLLISSLIFGIVLLIVGIIFYILSIRKNTMKIK